MVKAIERTVWDTIPGRPNDLITADLLVWDNILDRPLTFTPSAHAHLKADLPTSIAYKDEFNLFTTSQTIQGSIQLDGTGGNRLKSVLGAVQARNAADSAFVNLNGTGLRNTEGSLVLQAGAAWNDGSQVIFQNGPSIIGTMQATGVSLNVPATLNSGLNIATGNLTVSGSISTSNRLYVGGTNPQVSPLSSDGLDNRILLLEGGGDFGPTTRGGHIEIHGLEASGAGRIQIWAGLNADVRLGGELGGGFVETLRITSSGKAQFRNATWHGSISDGLDRFLFSLNSTTYYKGHGTGTIHEWRNGSDSNVMNLNSAGELRTQGYTYVPGLRVQSLGDGPDTVMGLGTLAVAGASGQIVIQARDAATNADASILYRNAGLFRVYQNGGDVLTLNNSGDIITNGYIKIGGTGGPLIRNNVGVIEVRNAANTSYATFVGDNIVSGAGLNFVDQTTRVSKYYLYTNAGSGVLYVRDMANARQQMQFNPGSDGNAAETYIWSRVIIEGTTSLGGGATAGGGTVGTFGNNNYAALRIGSAGNVQAFRILNAGSWWLGSTENVGLELQVNSVTRLSLNTAGDALFSGSVLLGSDVRVSRPSTKTFQVDCWEPTLSAWQRAQRAAASPTGIQWSVFDATPIGKQTLPAAATDAATTQTLCNAIRSLLIDFGFSN